MSKQIKQFILDQEIDLQPDSYKSLLNKKERVVMLGIQATPGTPFRLNGGTDIQMGYFGIYELDLNRIGGVIQSIEIKQAAQYPKNSKVIVDILYETEGE